MFVALALAAVLLVLSPLRPLFGSTSAPGSSIWEPVEVQRSVHDHADEVLTVVRDGATSTALTTAVLAVLAWCLAAPGTRALRPAPTRVRPGASHGRCTRRRAPPAR